MNGFTKALGAVALVALGIPVGILVNRASERLPDLRANYRQNPARVPPRTFATLEPLREKVRRGPEIQGSGSLKEAIDKWAAGIREALEAHDAATLPLRTNSWTNATITVTNTGKTVAKNVRLTVPGAALGIIGQDKRATEIEGEEFLIGEMQPSDSIEIRTWGQVVYGGGTNPMRLRSDEATGAVIDSDAPVKGFWDTNAASLLGFLLGPLVFFFLALRDKIKEGKRDAENARGEASRWKTAYEEMRADYLKSLKKPSAGGGGDAGFPRGG